jgi:glutamate decarboxylase
MIEKDHDFELITRPELNLLTYRYCPKDLQKTLALSTSDIKVKLNIILNELTVNIQKSQRDRGKSFVSRTSFDVAAYHNQTLTVFRVVLANPLTTPKVFEDIIAEQRHIAEFEMAHMDFATRVSQILKQ